MRVFNILNLGAGVQSTTVAMMSLTGELPRLDHVFFADTGWEPKAVYTHLEWLKEQFHKADVPLTVVSLSSIKDDCLHIQVNGNKRKECGRWGGMPFFVLNPDGTHGMVRRQCTYEYKIRPIEKAIKSEIFKIATGKRWPTSPVARRWYGISFDELQRMRTSQDKWATNWYPLIERRMDRTACFRWMHDNGFPEPPRSACIGCPFHSDREWAEMARERPDEFADACDFDDAIRILDGFAGKCFLHSKRIPLRDIQFDSGQLSLWDDECAGICGV